MWLSLSSMPVLKNVNCGPAQTQQRRCRGPYLTHNPDRRNTGMAARHIMAISGWSGNSKHKYTLQPSLNTSNLSEIPARQWLSRLPRWEASVQQLHREATYHLAVWNQEGHWNMVPLLHTPSAESCAYSKPHVTTSNMGFLALARPKNMIHRVNGLPTISNILFVAEPVNTTEHSTVMKHSLYLFIRFLQ